ncbi:MAG: ankyrin repeat domain-containing protein [Ferruginibacter sp.]|nr:ankyrin repeat domain-containing protein [Ferruginibacter sp.]
MQPRPQKGPPLDKELVKEFVTIAHSDFDKVKAMLKETPDLLNACYSWTDWDWEDAIGAAGHMGSRDMAIYLLDQGARPTIHVAAMLGQIGVVRSFIDDLPQMKNALGPHKLSLMHHAKKGGSYSKAVVNYLLSAGIKA